MTPQQLDMTKADRPQSPESLLESAIAHYINVHTVLPRDQQVLMASSLGDFVVDAIRKYVKGVEEHGGTLLDNDRDLQKEMYGEIIDMFFYNVASKWKKQQSLARSLKL